MVGVLEMILSEINLTKKCSECNETGKMWYNKKTMKSIRGYEIDPTNKDIKELSGLCEYCLGTKEQPTEFGIEIIKFVKTYLNVKT